LIVSFEAQEILSLMKSSCLVAYVLEALA
jgi:hypothetical protein